MTNCKNCGAPLHGDKCEYCGTWYGKKTKLGNGYFKCDPNLNKDCPKTHCYLKGGPCKHTLYPEFAIRNRLVEIFSINDLRDLFGGN